jgi:hypothetical protein
LIDPLPPEIAGDATIDGQEYGWKISSFPAALAAAERLGFACLGGQLQFRINGSIFEMYWLNADASDRLPGEIWSHYVQLPCSEVGREFTALALKLDVQKVVLEWPALNVLLAKETTPSNALVFVAYFVTEEEFAALG